MCNSKMANSLTEKTNAEKNLKMLIEVVLVAMEEPNCWIDISSLNHVNSTSCMKSMCHADEDEIIYQCILKGRKAIYLVSCDFIPFTRFFHNFFSKKETIIVK